VAAAIQLVRSEPAVAASTLERRLGEVGWECLEAAALAELLVAASIERGSVPSDLASRVRRLAELGEGSGCEVMVAGAERGRPAEHRRGGSTRGGAAP
jgi:hypothetical protein